MSRTAQRKKFRVEKRRINRQQTEKVRLARMSIQKKIEKNNDKKEVDTKQKRQKEVHITMSR
jgi:hypothetical protein